MIRAHKWHRPMKFHHECVSAGASTPEYTCTASGRRAPRTLIAASAPFNATKATRAGLGLAFTLGGSRRPVHCGWRTGAGAEGLVRGISRLPPLLSEPAPAVAGVFAGGGCLALSGIGAVPGIAPIEDVLHAAYPGNPAGPSGNNIRRIMHTPIQARNTDQQHEYRTA